MEHYMNIKPIVALTSLLLSFATVAVAAPVNELYPAAPEASTVTTKTRAAVVRDLVDARATGQIADGELGFAAVPLVAPQNQAVAARSRADVIAEVRQARADGSLIIVGEVEQFPAAQLAGTPRSRAEVRAEAIQSAQASHARYAVRNN
jgi:hypothetical protein